MKEFIHSRRFKVIICIFALLVGFMIYAAAAADTASIPEAALRIVTQPFARLSTTISNFVEGNIDKIVNADEYKNKNAELQQTISDLRKQLVDINELQNDNRLLREMLQITEENPDFEWPKNTCKITSNNANDAFGGFTINSGSDDGIKPFDLAVTGIGAVGIISEVGPNYSKVSTILSPETQIGVLSTRGNVKGVIQNDIIYAKDGLCRIGDIDKDADIAEGDIIVTLGTDMYPANQIIGEVTKVSFDSGGMSKYALVKPSEDVFRLTDVLVITNFEGKTVIENNE